MADLFVFNASPTILLARADLLHIVDESGVFIPEARNAGLWIDERLVAEVLKTFAET